MQLQPIIKAKEGSQRKEAQDGQIGSLQIRVCVQGDILTLFMQRNGGLLIRRFQSSDYFAARGWVPRLPDCALVEIVTTSFVTLSMITVWMTMCVPTS